MRAEKIAPLAELSDEKLVAYTTSLCAFVDPSSSTTTSSPTIYSEFLTATAASWGVSVDVVDSVAQVTNFMCPQAFQWLQAMPRTRGDLEVGLGVTGSGRAQVSFNVPDGSTLTDDVAAPWQQVLHLRQSQRVTLQVQPTDGAKVGCRVSLGEVVLAEQEPSTDPTMCDVTGADIDRGSAGA